MTERTRDVISEPVTLDYFQSKAEAGWKLVAVEWAREAGGAAGTAPLRAAPDREEVPYGYRISPDCTYLEQDPIEVAVLLVILEKVVSEWRAPKIAEELNTRGYHTRSGAQWTASAVFDLLPRLIEMGPRLLKRPDWPDRRQKLALVK